MFLTYVNKEFVKLFYYYFIITYIMIMGQSYTIKSTVCSHSNQKLLDLNFSDT